MWFCLRCLSNWMHNVTFLYLHLALTSQFVFNQKFCWPWGTRSIVLTWVSDLGVFLPGIRQAWVCLLTSTVPFLCTLLWICVNKINYEHYGQKQSPKQLVSMPKFLGVLPYRRMHSGERCLLIISTIFPSLSHFFYYTCRASTFFFLSFVLRSQVCLELTL